MNLKKNSFLKRLCFATASLALLANCASKHPGRRAAPILGESQTLEKIVVSAKRVSHLPTKSFELIEITIENTGDGWQRFSGGEVVLAASEKNLSVVVGEDLVTWQESYNEIVKLQDFNSQIATGTLALAGAAVALSSKDRNTRALGLATAAAATGAHATNEFLEDRTKVTSPDWVPETHLHKSFSVPGGLFTRRWILLNKPSGISIEDLVIRLHSLDSQSYAYKLTL